MAECMRDSGHVWIKHMQSAFRVPCCTLLTVPHTCTNINSITRWKRWRLWKRESVVLQFVFANPWPLWWWLPLGGRSVPICGERVTTYAFWLQLVSHAAPSDLPHSIIQHQKYTLFALAFDIVRQFRTTLELNRSKIDQTDARHELMCIAVMSTCASDI